MKKGTNKLTNKRNDYIKTNTLLIDVRLTFLMVLNNRQGYQHFLIVKYALQAKRKNVRKKLFQTFTGVDAGAVDGLCQDMQVQPFG